MAKAWSDYTQAQRDVLASLGFFEDDTAPFRELSAMRMIAGTVTEAEDWLAARYPGETFSIVAAAPLSTPGGRMEFTVFAGEERFHVLRRETEQGVLWDETLWGARRNRELNELAQDRLDAEIPGAVAALEFCGWFEEAFPPAAALRDVLEEGKVCGVTGRVFMPEEQADGSARAALAELLARLGLRGSVTLCAFGPDFDPAQISAALRVDAPGLSGHWRCALPVRGGTEHGAE